MKRAQEAWPLLVKRFEIQRYMATLELSSGEYAAWQSELGRIDAKLNQLASKPGQQPLHPHYADVIRHALGVDMRKARSGGYRNHFCPGGDDVGRVERLVGKGYMEWCGSPIGGLEWTSRVTKEGAIAAGVLTAYNKWVRSR